jgi:hypothetical protein
MRSALAQLADMQRSMEHNSLECVRRLANEMELICADGNKLIDKFSLDESRMLTPDFSIFDDLVRRSAEMLSKVLDR